MPPRSYYHDGMMYRRKSGPKTADAFTRIGISLRNKELALLEALASRWQTSRSAAIGRLIVEAAGEVS